MEPKQPRIRGGPEAKIQAAIMTKLQKMGWVVVHLHASVYMVGMPDLYATHLRHGVRLIEVKDPNRSGDVFTAAQRKNFPLLSRNGSPIWVLTSDSDAEIAKLFGPQNWLQFLDIMRI